MQQAGHNVGLIQWDTPNNKNTLLAAAGGMTHFNCACTNLSHSKKCCSYTQHFLQLSGALCGSGRSGGSAILFLWVSAGLTDVSTLRAVLNLNPISGTVRWVVADAFDHLNL